MSLQFLHSGYLGLILPAIGIVWFFGRKRRAGDIRHGSALLWISLGCILAVIAALAEPYLGAMQKKTCVFLADVSESVSDTELAYVSDRIREITASLEGDTDLHLVCYASYPLRIPEVNFEDDSWDLARMRKSEEGALKSLPDAYYRQTNIQAAILYAQMLIKEGGVVYVFTDGLETRGRAETAIPAGMQTNIQFHYETLNSWPSNEVILSGIQVPKRVQQGQNASMQVLLDSSRETSVDVIAHNLNRNTKQRYPFVVHAGINQVSVPIDTFEAPVVSYQLLIESPADTSAENNHRQVSIPILRKPVITVLGAGGQGNADEGIENWLSNAADVRAWSEQMDLNGLDALFIADTDANDLTPDRIGRIRDAVDAGMGLMVFPGPQLVADRLLTEGPLAELLPVHLYQDSKKTNPDTTVVFIIDTSGSMTGSRTAVAREIARLAIGRLAPYDKVGIVEFYGNRRWAAPIQSAANQLDLYRALNRLTPGGGTVIIPAMEEAYYAMLNVNSTTRHIVVISDGGVENADYEALLRKIADSRISVSTILVGPVTHAGFMAELSQWGQGGFFHAEERFILPDLNFKSVLDKTGSPYCHTTDPLVARYPSTLLSGISLPRLTGSWDYLPAQVKKGGQAVLEFSSGQPMVSLWHYGLGGVVFWSVDLFHQQTADTDISQIAANLSRKIYRTQSQDILFQVEQTNNVVDFQVQKPLDPQTAPEAKSLVIYADPADKIKLPLSFADGRSECVSVQDLAEGQYQVDIEDSEGRILLQSGFSVNEIPEMKACQSDQPLMDRLNRMSGLNPVTQSGPTRAGTVELWPYCILLSMVLFLLHILIRRLPFPLRKGSAVWAVLWLIPFLAAYAAAETVHADLPAADSSAQEVFVRMDPNTHRPLFPDLAAKLNNQPVNLKTTAILCGDFVSAEALSTSSPIRDFADGMLTGFCFYRLGKYSQAYEAFQCAVPMARTIHDRKYALAWSLRMAEKSDRRNSFEAQLLNSDPFLNYHCRILELLYGLKNDPNGLKQLYDKIKILPEFTEADKTRMEQQIIDMSVDSGSDLQAASFGTDMARGQIPVTFLLGQVRAFLIRGDRARAAHMLEAMVSDPNLTDDWLLIAQNSARMAFYDMADNLAARVMDLSDTQRYAAGIFRVTLMLSIGRQSKAIEILDELQKTVKLDERQEYEIAQYYEKLGQYSRAIEQYRQIYLRTRAVDVQMRQAWLHEKNGDYDQAYQAWLTLWKDCRQPALLYQIQPRLLEVASRTGQLASLAVQLEESLEKNGLDIKALELLVDLYVSVGDSIAAVELVRQYRGDAEIESLEWQYRIYLRCREYGRSRRVLYQLIEKDPRHAGDYYRQLALLAVEKGDEKDALRVVESIRSRQTVDTIDLEYIAGIWDLLERPELAMESYGQLLDQESPAAEIWLLWSAAAAKAGHKEMAITTLSGLLADDVSDDLFTVAVDALLNLKADPICLENALVQIYARIARAPDKVFFYRLAVDVLSEIGGGSDYAEFLFPASLYAPDGRVVLLQEIQRAAASGQTGDSLDYGIVLVYMDAQLPPHTGIELGKSFLERGEYKTAHFLFHRTPYLFEDSSLSLGIAEAYDRIGAFHEAALVVREALAVTPDNPQLLIRSASYDEIKGDWAAAWEGYLRAYQLTLNSLSAPSEASAGDPKAAVKNIQTEDRNFQIALHGLLATMDSPERADSTLQYFESTLDGLNQQDIKSDHIAYARLMQIWKNYEQICLARGDRIRADEQVRSIVEKFTDNPEFLAVLISNRLAGGDSKGAFEIAGKIDRKHWPPEMKWQMYPPSEASDRTEMTDERLHASLMKSVLSNESEQAGEWLEEILSRQGELPNDELQAVELTSVILLDGPDSLRRVISKQCAAWAQSPAAVRSVAVNRLIASVWPVLPEADRKWLISQIAASGASDADIQHTLDVILIGSQDKTFYPLERACEYAESKDKQADRLAEILSYSDPNQRNGIVQRAVDSLPAAQRCIFLLELADQIRHPVTEQEQNGYGLLFKSCLPIKLPPQNQYVQLSRYTGRNRSSRLLLLDFAEILLSEMPDHTAMNAWAMKARFHAGRPKEAASLARNMIDTLAEAGEINYEFKAILGDCVRALSQEDLREILSDCMLSLDITGPSSSMYFITAVLNETLGNPLQARIQMGHCFRRMPDNMIVLRQLIDWYEAAGLKKELTDLLSAYVQASGSSDIFLRRTLVRLYYQTGREEPMKRAAAQDMTILHNLNYLALYEDVNDVSNLVTYFRKTQTDFRNEGRFLSLVWPDWDSPDGFLGWYEEQNRTTPRRDMHQVLSRQPALWGDYHRLWQAMTPDRNDFLKVADAYAHILSMEGRTEKEINTILNKDQELSQKEFVLLLHLIKYEGSSGVLSYPLILDSLRNHPGIPDIDTLEIMAAAYRAMGQKSISQQYYRWIWIYRMITQPESETIFDALEVWLKNNDKTDINILENIKPWINPESFNENKPAYESRKTRFISDWYDDQTYQARMRVVKEKIVTHEYDITYIPLQRDMLRYSLQSDQPDLFTRTFYDMLRTQALFVAADTTIDFRYIISDVPEERMDRYIGLIRNQMNELYSQNILTNDDMVRNLAILAVALHKNNYQSQAAGVLDQIYPLKREASIVSLWVSDALRECGRIEAAKEIDRELIRNGSMPKIRTKTMLSRQ